MDVQVNQNIELRCTKLDVLYAYTRMEYKDVVGRMGMSMLHDVEHRQWIMYYILSPPPFRQGSSCCLI